MVPSTAKTITMHRAERAILSYRTRVALAQVPRGKPNRKKRPANLRQGPPVTVGTLADDTARLHAISAMIDANNAHRRRYVKLDKLGIHRPRHFLFTGCYDDGLIIGDTITEMQIDRVIDKTYRLIRDMGLHGVFALQIVGIRDERDNTYHVWLHVHGLTFTQNIDFTPVKTAKALSQRRAYPNTLGAPSITLRSRKHSARLFRNKQAPFYKFAYRNLKLDQTKASLSHLAYYILHPPEFMLKLVPSKTDPAKGKLRSNKGDYPAWLANRIHQLENQIPLVKAVFSVGQGKEIRSMWKRLYVANCNLVDRC
ncbi:hypothetical protein P8R33_03785 [Qipengyuania sp. XHP0211]|uniref:hypothetical protein n=1 Tax=Qipengyuania sp. XHP0211 TaxID=3038079 RepID=UPI00241C936E|nr:hypothetical protein [Qipengyuania sp. XHP0211]MDG5750220.1 hypothetical protein [Qipengyuania sp. XHP0211]